MASDNPARVLADVLIHVRAIVDSPGGSAITFWTRAYDLGGPELARKLARIQQLPDEVRKTVTRLGLDPEPVDRLMARVEVAMLNGLHVAWQEFWTTLGGDATVDSLIITAGYIDASEPDRYPIDDVDGLREKLETLLVEVVESDLDEFTKRLVRDRIIDLIDALADLDVSTTAKFHGAVERLVGLLATLDDVYDALKQSKVGKALLRVLAALLMVHGATGTPVIELGTPDQAIVRCLDPGRVPALPAGSAPDTSTDDATP